MKVGGVCEKYQYILGQPSREGLNVGDTGVVFPRHKAGLRDGGIVDDISPEFLI